MSEIITHAGHILDKALISARDDNAAIDSFLEEYIYRPNTHNSYKTECKKLRVFLAINNLKLGSIKKEDLKSYIAWLSNPPKQLVGTQGALFKGPLSPKSVRQNIRVINNMLNFLIEADYINKNPLRLIKQFPQELQIEGNKFEVLSKVLDEYEVSLVLKAVDNLPQNTEAALHDKMRTELIISMLYYLGLRVSELSDSIWSNFKITDGRCWYYLVGKGGIPGKIPVNSSLLTTIRNYRRYYGKPTDVDEFEHDYILCSKKSARLSARRIREIVKEVFKAAAMLCDNENSKTKLLGASPHDFRHLLASTLDRLGASILDTKEILRHSSQKTTEIYRHSQDISRHNMAERNKVALGGAIANAKGGYKLEFCVRCTKSEVFGFRYFLNSVATSYLKKYRLATTLDVDGIIAEYEAKAPTYGELNLQIVIMDAVSKDEIAALCKLIEQAADARGINMEKL